MTSTADHPPPPSNTPNIVIGPNPSHASSNLPNQHSHLHKSSSTQLSPQLSGSSTERFPNKNLSPQSSNPQIERRNINKTLQIETKDGQRTIITTNTKVLEAKPDIKITRPEFPTSQSQPQINKPNPTIEKQQKGENTITFSKDITKYSISELEELDNYENCPNLVDDDKPRLTRGYISLLNYLREMNESQSGNHGQFGGNQKQYYSKPQNKNNATLIDTGKNSYQPIIIKKELNLWDNESTEAFKMNVKQGFNRLTVNKIQQVVKELLPSVNTPERKLFLVRTFVTKASQEKNFAPIYAQFVSMLENKDAELYSDIISHAKNSFQDYILNPADTPNDINDAAGITALIAALIQNHCISSGAEELARILNAIPIDGEIKEVLILMLFSFVELVGSEFLEHNQIDYAKIDQLIARSDIPPRLRFKIIDIKEIITGKAKKQTSTVVQSKTFQQRVRSGFASFRDNDQVVPNDIKSPDSVMTAAEFISGSMEIFPDIQKNDIYFYTYYQCFVLKQLAYQVTDVINLLIKYVKQFSQQNLESDSPLIWVNISNLLCQMMINEILKPQQAQQIHRAIFANENDNWNPINDLKYFIQDNYDFSMSLDLRPEFANQEISEALKMPQTVTRKLKGELRMSRFIAMAVVRSAFAHLREYENMTLDELQTYKTHLQTAAKKQSQAFREALEDEFAFADYPFTIDDIYRHVINN